ncbi:Card1-like endonuclease domain-containing protein [Methylobacter sp. BlB1]|uniref:Card1-like endonuclease domain-containing protein n=1 Tax=Methylobacter sp. BlB1 TaxID=2785914 RepID=UPI00351BB79E
MSPQCDRYDYWYFSDKLVSVVRMRLYLIECRTKHFVLYKLDSLCNLVGGLQGRAMLASFNMFDKISGFGLKSLK